MGFKRWLRAKKLKASDRRFKKKYKYLGNGTYWNKKKKQYEYNI